MAALSEPLVTTYTRASTY